MKINSILLIFAFLSVVLISCQTDIDFSGTETSTLLVVNSIITPDSIIKVQVSESKFFLDNDSKFNDVLNAIVKIWVNDIEQPVLKHVGNGLYVSSYIPKAGDIIRITAKNDKYAEVKSTTEVLAAIPVLSVDTSYKVTDKYPIFSYYGDYGSTADTIGYNYNIEMKMKLHIKDPKETDNYYRLLLKTVEYYDNGMSSMNVNYFNSDDPVFGSTSEEGIFGGDSYSIYSVFSDALFNGKDYNLRISTNYFSYYTTVNDPPKTEDPDVNTSKIVKKELLFELQSISKSYYLYLKSREASSNVMEFFSEPVQIYNNIEGGIGIFGNYNTSYFKMEIPKEMGNQYLYY
jgi:hypothetical protein